MRVPVITGRWLRPKNRTCPRCSGPDAARRLPTRGEREGEPVEGLVAGLSGQRIAKQRSADHQYDATTIRRRRITDRWFVVGNGDREVTSPASASRRKCRAGHAGPPSVRG